MTLEEIKSALAKIVVDMCNHGFIRPDADFTVKANADFSLCLQAAEQGFGNSSYKWIYGDTPNKCIDQAVAFIVSLPSPQIAVMQNYLGKLADAVDYGHANNVPAEYVDPVRITQKAMSDNLLAAPAEAVAS